MSGSAKEDDKDERRAPARELSTPPARAPSQKLFELDAPGDSGPHALGLPQLSAAAARPANDVPQPRAAGAGPLGSPRVSLTGDPIRDAQLIDAEFAALANTSELEAPILAAHEAAAQGATAQRYETRPFTHVPADQDFDATLRLPRLSEAIEARRGRLAVRYKAACAAYKILFSFEIGAAERKELVELFSAYESGLRAALPPAAAGDGKRDADSLHSLLPAPGLDELERALTKIEERLLALDETLPEDDFRAAVSKLKLPLKSLLRYARVLASKRFNIGYRRDRFEYLAFELLTTQSEDKRLQLLPRDRAGTVLHHLLAGLPQAAAPEERAPATAHMREALEQLAKIDGPEEFFDSEFFLDLHGYKISMRDQITCPEFLYLSTAVHVELHNRMLLFCRSGSPSWQSLQSRLAAQQAAAEHVFTNFRRPRAAPLVKSHQAAPAKDAQPQPVPPRRKRKRRKATADDKPDDRLKGWLKIGGLALLIVLTSASALFSAGVVRLEDRRVALTAAQLQALSPMLVRATLSTQKSDFEGLVRRVEWQRLARAERRTVAQELAQKLQQKGIANARVLAHQTPVIRIEFSTVVFVDETSTLPQ